MAKDSTNSYILRVCLPTPLRKTFDYLPPQGIDIRQLMPGVRVRVPFQSRSLIGTLLSVEKNSTVPEDKLKAAIQILDHGPLLTEDLFKLCEFASRYYHCSLGEVLAHCLPGLLRKGKELPKKFKPFDVPSIVGPALQLNEPQQAAVDTILSHQQSFHVFLLNGVTGSGKTEVYLQVIANLLTTNKQILILVPEISLTPQTVSRFQARFNVPIVALHSNLSEKKRAEAWVQAKSDEIKIIIGTRSALFTPFANLGLIIIDEEHDLSFKQQDHFRYHARDLAIVRARLNNVPIVLGSATPSLESLYNAARGRYTSLVLPYRAGGAVLPTYQLIDLRTTQVVEGLSQPLLDKIGETLKQNKQVMLFLNRRGFAPVMYCTSCAHIINCKRCATRMVCHQAPLKLHCHQCGAKILPPSHCPSCRNETLYTVGVGTQRLERVLTEHFPSVPIIRIDSDNTRRKGSLEALLAQIQQESQAILIGTQILAKGHHFPNVHLVGMIDVDNGFFSADFRASEHMGQLLLQVGGRAGREDLKGTVLIQTRYPEHEGLQLLLSKGHGAYSKSLLAERESAALPPFSHMALFHAESHDINVANNFLINIKNIFPTHEEINLYGPVNAPLSKRKGFYRQQLIVKSSNRQLLQMSIDASLSQIEKMKLKNKVRWGIDIDPVG